MSKVCMITVFSDGSSTVYKNNDNKRYGGIGVYFEDYPEYNFAESFANSDVSNQLMELTAALKAIEKVVQIMTVKNKYWELCLYTDSMYVINIITKWAPKWIQLGWKRKPGKKEECDLCHLDVIKELYTLCKLYPVTLKHVRSHQKEPNKETEPDKWNKWNGNKQADKLATTAMLQNKINE